MVVDLAAARRRARLESTRNGAAEYLAEQEDRFADVVAAAFRAVFAPVLDRFAAGLTAAGFASPDDLNTIRADWVAEVEHTLAPMVSAMYDTGALSALLAHRAAVDARNVDETLDLLDDVLDRNASAYLESATNRLVGIGDAAWATARETLLDGFTLGESVPDLAARVQDALGVAENRATTIARTEVVGASNAGSYDGATALGKYGPARKVWLATVDTRTREAHMDADGQTVGLDEPFLVDGEELEFPGDPAGSAGNIIHSRCTLIYEESDDPSTDLDAPGRGQGGTDPDPLTDEALADLAASSEEHPTMARRTQHAVRTRSGFAVPPPPAADAPATETPAPADAPAPEVPAHDITLTIPEGVMVRPFEVVLAVEGRWTGDDRFVLPGAIRWDGMLPMTIDANHDETVEQSIGLLGEVVRVPGPNPGENLIVGRGFFDLGRAERPHEAAQFAVDRIETGVCRQASMSVDDETLGGVDPNTLEPGEDEWWMMVVEDCRLRAVTVCAVGAFAECGFTLDPEGVDVNVTDLPPAPDGPVAITRAEADAIREQQEAELEDLLEEVGMPVIIAGAGTGYQLVAARPPADAPPIEWFADPDLTGPTPLTIDDDGRIYGHIATWGTCHTGFAGQCITPPHSATGYAAFRTGEVVTREGTRVATGRLTAGTGHANKNLAAGPAAAHYDDTGFAYGDVAAGEDRFGLWVAGAVRPTATPEQVQVARSSPPSGDWRRIGTSMELVAALHVNSPGFPIARARTASGVPQSLVAAGIVTEAMRTTPPDVAAAAARIARSIGRDDESLVAALAARVHPEE